MTATLPPLLNVLDVNDVESVARVIVKANGYSGALLLAGDRMFRATTTQHAAAWKRVAEWLLDHPNLGTEPKKFRAAEPVEPK